MSTSSLRVCHIISSFRPLVGGAELRTERLCKQLKLLGVDIVIVTRRYPGLDRFDTLSGVRVYRLGHASRSKFGALTFILHSLWLLATSLRAYNIVHVQSTHAPVLVGLAAKGLLRRKLFVTIRTSPSHLFRQPGNIRFFLIKRMADVVGALNAEMIQQLIACGMPRERIKLLPTGIDTRLFYKPTSSARSAVRHRLGLPDDAIVYLFVGRLVPLKRVDLLLEAWARLQPNVTRTLLIVGDGPELETLQAIVARKRLTDVTFAGASNHVHAYTQAADVFVLPSEREGLSNALLEAMASGLTVIVSDLAANRTVVRNGSNGLTFPVDDLEALVEQLTVTESPLLRQRLGDAAVQSVQTTFGLDNMAAVHCSLYSQFGLATAKPLGRSLLSNVSTRGRQNGHGFR
jgi:glycosyltransferase involved in cell wall biosynthesis